MDSFEATIRSMDFDYFGTGGHKTTPQAFFDRTGAVFLDLRSEPEFDILPIRIASLQGLHIPMHELPDRYGEIPSDKPIGLFCSNDTRSSIALAYLKSRGFADVRIIIGGYAALMEELKPGKVHKRSRAGD